jgi:DNA repair protein RadD
MEMLAVTYYGGLSDRPITEYITILHEGYAGQKAARTLAQIARGSGAPPGLHSVAAYMDSISQIADLLNKSNHPALIRYQADGKFHRVIERIWA